jgi:hypothetical protein
MWGSNNSECSIAILLGKELCCTHVDHGQVTFFVDYCVLGLEVTVDDVFLVQVLDCEDKAA